MPSVSGNTVTALFVPEPANAPVDTTLLRFLFEGEPECEWLWSCGPILCLQGFVITRYTRIPIYTSSHCVTVSLPLSLSLSLSLSLFPVAGVLYNGVGGPDNATAIAASPFFVSLGQGGSPTLVPATPCFSMLQNGSCYFEPETCTGFNNVTCPKNRCCWSPTINNGQCLDKGAPCYKGKCCT